MAEQLPLPEVIRHLTRDELERGLDVIRQAPRDTGVLKLIVRRPRVGEREILQEGELDSAVGLVGDTWQFRQSKLTGDGSPHPEMQINIMNTRVVALVAQDERRWALAGDQFFVDLDLSQANLPPGTRLVFGSPASAVLEITSVPHTGCQKFVSRFGLDAMKFVNSPLGRELNLRGINARVVQPGVVRVGDVVTKVPVEATGGELARA